MQIAAVIAARFNANAPNGASAGWPRPFQPITGEIGTVTGGADHRYARHVLRSHGDDEQRQGDAEHRRQRKKLGCEDRLRQPQVQPVQMQQALAGGDGDPSRVTMTA